VLEKLSSSVGKTRYKAADTELALFSRADFTQEVQATRVTRVDLPILYGRTMPATSSGEAHWETVAMQPNLPDG
jgi:hypothetical protein